MSIYKVFSPSEFVGGLLPRWNLLNFLRMWWDRLYGISCMVNLQVKSCSFCVLGIDLLSIRNYKSVIGQQISARGLSHVTRLKVNNCLSGKRFVDDGHWLCTRHVSWSSVPCIELYVVTLHKLSADYNRKNCVAVTHNDIICTQTRGCRVAV